MPKKETWSRNFEVKNNLLFYVPSADNPSGSDHNLKVEGKWDITKNGRLRFMVDHAQNQVFGKTITIGTELSKVNTGSLEFKAAQRVTPSGKNVSTITLDGELTALPGKKLAFMIEREGAVDTLKLSGTWDVFDGNQIGCMVKHTNDGKQTTNLVVLKGTWKIAGNTISYQVEDSNKPFLAQEFAIKRAIYTDKKNGIDFSLGASIRQETTKKATCDIVSLKGTWKQNGTKADFIFTSAKKQTFSFILSQKLSNDKELIFELDAGEGQKPSFAVTFSKKIKDDASFFVRGKVCGNDKRVEAGFYFPF
jgi:hypothetical protein